VVRVEEGPRRSGDPAMLVADATLAREELGWKPIYSDLHTIIRHAWQWEMMHTQSERKRCAA
jgi:UDP-glucose 4-epimerase